MMSNLNLSIEDLLQKISRVTHNYEPSMEGEVDLPPLMFGKSRVKVCELAIKKEEFRGGKGEQSSLATETTSKYCSSFSSK